MPEYTRPCKNCGSGELWYWLRDAQGIVLQPVCRACKEEAKKRYNKWVFEGYDQAFLDEYSGERIDEDY